MGRLSLISPLKARDPKEAHLVTTQLELFFDPLRPLLRVHDLAVPRISGRHLKASTIFLCPPRPCM